ncbi:CGNR zinc finger domain-containing protein [Marinimicrobium sp. ARAG 43.8]|uniref:CGNR zinc finger domain-containing protein n=1 Tax=Marinimicrobium sp. ARAG 43.8 TaxID=3418719 RepID=UPI003CEB3D2C
MSSDIAPLFIAGNLALDFINTLFGAGADQRECLEDGDSVVAWLRQSGALAEEVKPPPAELLPLARALREEMKRLVNAAKEGQAAEPVLVNQVLERGHPVERMEWRAAEAAFTRTEKRRDLSAEGLLQPVARAFVELLTDENLQLVKECEACDCVLMFHDQTKSHRRRWCSMASCGNRAKALLYRERRKAK